MKVIKSLNLIIKINLPNDTTLSELDDKSLVEDRTTFEFLKNIFSNLRRKN